MPRYLASGKWDPHATIPTLSNAMDISRPNNWPRVEALVKMQGWSLNDFAYGRMTDEETKATMKALYAKTGYILEPHAAIAYQVLKDNLQAGETGIFLGTAHPAKFKDTVDTTLGIDFPLPQALAARATLEDKKMELKPDYEALKAFMLQELA